MRTYITIILLLCATSFTVGQTISGLITSDTVWTLASSPITVTGTVTVASNAFLTIQPGVVVQFASGTSLLVLGKINANGTSANPITFTSAAGSPTPGDWNSIEFQNTANAGSVFNYCIVQYGGGGSSVANISYTATAFGVPISNSIVRFSFANGLNLRASSPSIKNTRFESNASYGIFSDIFSYFGLDSSSVKKNTLGGIRIPLNSYPTITNSTIDSNGVGVFVDVGAYPTIKNNFIRYNTIGLQYVAPGATQPVIINNTFSGNTSWGFQNNSTVFVKAERNFWGSASGPYNAGLNPTGLGDRVSDNVDFQPWNSGGTLPVTQVTSTITSNTLWSSGVYWIKNSISVNSGVTLTVNPGVVVKFAHAVSLTVNGTIIANGKPDSLIVFTSDKDDSYGGDTNGDTTATGPNPNDWSGVLLSAGQNANSVFNNCIFKFGNNNLEIDNIAPSTFANIYSTNASGYGLYLYASNTYIYKSVFGGNGSYGVYSNYTSQISIRKSSFQSNKYEGMRYDGSGGIVFIDSCTFIKNGGSGVYCWSNIASEAFTNNTFDSNGDNGLWCYNLTGTVTISKNTFINNTNDGIVTSKAFITNNTIQGNRYPIALVQRVGSTYSGNTITGNQYNNALGLRVNRESLSDTLKRVFPAGITSGTYVVTEASPSGWQSTPYGVASGATLVIDSGVIVKMDPSMFLSVQGTLITNSTPTSPIVFTSYRDASYGGKTNLVSDTNRPAPGDWNTVVFYNNTSSGSVLNNCIFKYGGSQQLYFYSVGTLTNPVTNIISRRASGSGIWLVSSLITMTNSTVDSCGNYYGAIYCTGTGTGHTELTLRASTIQDNKEPGLYADGTSAFKEISNCTIRRNNGNGIYVADGSVPEMIVGNTITNNAGSGLALNSTTLQATDVNLVSNTITDNSMDGVASSRAWFRGNTILRNRYPIAVWGRLGNIYKDNTGTDQNTITGNTYNNAIAIRIAISLSDTLKRVFPAGITSGTYVVTEASPSGWQSGPLGVVSGNTLVIDSGVIIKMNPTMFLSVQGTLITNSTPTSPIIFTSYRDASYGGKTNLVSDTNRPAPNDWAGAVLYTSGAAGSVLNNCIFKYGGSQQLEFYNVGALTNPVTNIISRRASGSGIYLVSSLVTMTYSTVDSCGNYYGAIYCNGTGAQHSELTLRGSTIQDNKAAGLYADGTSAFKEVSNCTIRRNNGNGIYVLGATIPMSIVQDTISTNTGDGIYVLTQNAAVDTLLIIVGNKVLNNTGIGIASSRAYISNDSIIGNRYSIGVVGEISLAGTSYASGNIYKNNVITGNLFNNVVATEGTIVGILGGSYPTGFVSKTIAARGDVKVASSSTLTIIPGTVIKFPNEGRGAIFGAATSVFQVNGVLKSEGTSSNKIVFTSWKDDSFGGDSNNDSTATVPTPNDWYGLYLSAADVNSHVLNTIVRYGSINIYLSVSNAPIDSSYSSYAYNYGLYTSQSNSPITGCEIHHNPYGIYVVSTANPVISKCNIHDNSSYGLYNATSNTINAANNYWGDPTGPLVNQGSDQNLSGLGNKIGLYPGAVTYKPFMFTRSGILLGDVSGNGTISAYDASLVLQYLVSLINLTAPQLAAADVSGDGTVSALDASYILRYDVGIISGFPGLGKISSGTSIASAYDLAPASSSSTDNFDYILHLNGKSAIYSAELKVEFDKDAISFVSMTKSNLADSLTSFSNAADNYVSVALAGIKPVTEEGDLVKLTFHAKNGITRNWSTALHISKFVLNETNLTQTLTDVKITSQTLKGIPVVFNLSQNYPNPFNPTTTIEYQLPIAGVVSIRVYDLLGKEIAVLINQEQKAGYYALNWNGRNMAGQSVASGTYLYRVQVATDDHQSFTAVKRMILLK